MYRIPNAKEIVKIEKPMLPLVENKIPSSFEERVSSSVSVEKKAKKELKEEKKTDFDLGNLVPSLHSPVVSDTLPNRPQSEKSKRNINVSSRPRKRYSIQNDEKKNIPQIPIIRTQSQLSTVSQKSPRIQYKPLPHVIQKSNNEEFHEGYSDEEEIDDNFIKKKSNSILMISIFIIVLAIGLTGLFYILQPKPLPFCITGSPSIPGECIRCPINGLCPRKGYHCDCPPGYIVSQDRSACIQDSSIPLLAEKIIIDTLKPRIERRKGDFICGVAREKDYSEEEVKAVIKTEFHKLASENQIILFNEVYQHVLSLLDIHELYNQNGRFGTFNEGSMTLSCKFYLIWNTYWYLFPPTLALLLYISFKYIINRRKNKVIKKIHKTLKEKKNSDSKISGVYPAHLSDTFCKYRTRYSLNYYVWKEIIKDIQHDSRIVETPVSINGKQETYWEWNA